jgi:TctA family transporter
MLFATRPDFVWGLIASMYIANIVGVVLVLMTVPMFAALLRIPFAIIGPMIVAICFVGAYTVSNATFDLWLVLVFGLLGYLFVRLDYPLAPLVLSMVLGHKAENAFYQSMVLSDGSLAIFFSNALVGGIMALALALLIVPKLFHIGSRLRRKAPVE